MPQSQPKIPMKALQRADVVLGRLACLCLSPFARLGSRRAGRPTRRILVIKFWGIGSIQLLTPAARALRERHPDAELTLLTLAENEAFASGLGVFDRVLTLDVASQRWTTVLGRIAKLLLRLRRYRPDEVFDFEFFTRFSAVTAFLSGAPKRHGFHSPNVWRAGLHTRTVPFNRYWHVARNFRALAGAESGFDVEPDELVPFRTDLAVRERIGTFLEERGIDDARPLVVLNPNAGRLSLERRWPRERFAQLARELVARERAHVVLIGTAAEAEYTAGVRELAPEVAADVHDLAGGLDVGELCALLERADLVVSNDSGPMHLAAALGTPTLGLFGPETPVMYRPMGLRTRVLWDPPVCSPCINVHDNKVANCIHGQPECLMNISSADVVEAACDLLEGARMRPVAREHKPAVEQRGLERRA